MEVNDKEFKKKEMRSVALFCYRLSKIASETIKLIKEACKDKCFGKSIIFRWHGDFKVRHMSAELAPKPGQPESVVNDQNNNTMWIILQEKHGMTWR